MLSRKAIDAKVVKLDGAGHYLAEERPELVQHLTTVFANDSAHQADPLLTFTDAHPPDSHSRLSPPSSPRMASRLPASPPT